MTKDKNNHDEAIRRIVSRTRLDKPSEGFSARIMDRLLAAQPEPVKKWMITYQYGILAIAAGVAIMMLIFPAWTVFDFDVKMVGTSAAQMAGNLVTEGAVWVGQMFGKIGALGKYAYFIPVSVAILLVSVFDQVISHKPQTDRAKS
ncbi:MAG: hypothetical protein Q7U54_09540 [Bacteroidales bacterium]|nr:hypothetical protein [Bacteroidales bacterium]